MKKTILLSLIISVILGCSQTFDNSILKFQKELIASETTGSNVAMILKMEKLYIMKLLIQTKMETKQ